MRRIRVDPSDPATLLTLLGHGMDSCCGVRIALHACDPTEEQVSPALDEVGCRPLLTNSSDDSTMQDHRHGNHRRVRCPRWQSWVTDCISEGVPQRAPSSAARTASKPEIRQRIDELIKGHPRLGSRPCDDVAFGHGLIRIGGTLNNGNKTERWLRSTHAFGSSPATGSSRDQVSVPLDLEGGRALLNLEW